MTAPRRGPLAATRPHRGVAAALAALLATSTAWSDPAPVRQRQAIHGPDVGIERPARLAHIPALDEFLVAGAGGFTEVMRFNSFREPAGRVTLPAGVSDLAAMAWDPVRDGLLLYDPTDRVLWLLPAGSDGVPESARALRLNGPRAGFVRAAGMCVDPVSGDVLVLDRVTRRILRFAPAATGEPDPRWVAGAALAGRDVAGLAWDGEARQFHVLDRRARRVLRLNEGGALDMEYDAGSVELTAASDLVLAPSGDRTDPASVRHLFVADPGSGRAHGHVFELGWPAAPAGAAPLRAATPASFTATLVRAVATSSWSPPSPDPSGIAYDAVSGRLVITDGEVEEMAIYAGKNVWESSLSGVVQRSYAVTSFTPEPVGVAHDPDTRQLYISDDDAKRVFKVSPGADNLIGTADDSRTSFSTTAFGSGDPEGLAFDRAGKRLFIADGVNEEIYVLLPGANGVIDGVSPGGDDVLTQFDLSVHGIDDPETVEYRDDTGTLLVLGRTSGQLVELTTAGTVVSTTDLSAAPLDNPAGMAFAPSSGNPAQRSLYIVNRAVDNDCCPTENDGTLVELALDAPPPPTGNGGDFRIAAGSDDVEEMATGSLYTNSSDLELVHDDDDQIVGLRFTGVRVEPGASITRAYIQFEADEVQSEATQLTVRGQAADNPPTFTSATRPSTRAATGAAVAWSPPAWTTVGQVGADQRTPDLTGIVREIVGRPGWASGNAMVFLISGLGHRTARAFEGKPAGAALLHIEVMAAPVNTPPTVSAGPDRTVVLPAAASLDGTVTDDGLPSGTLTTTWSQASGPGTTSFTNPGAVDTQAGFSAPGVYVLRLEASDGALSAVDEVVVTVQPAPPADVQTLERRVAGRTDDAEENLSTGAVSTSSSDLELIRDGSSDQIVGLRFTGVTVPRNATITGAWVQFTTDEAATSAASLVVRGQAAGNAPTFAKTAAGISARPRTAASAAWSPPAWGLVGEAGPAQRTPDLAPILQEIVNRADWVLGNGLVILVTGAGRRTAESYEGGPAVAPLLHIEYR